MKSQSGTENTSLKKFENLIEKKYLVYNSLFLNLPYQGVDVGQLLPLLSAYSEESLRASMSPIEIIDSFFDTHTHLKTEDERNDFLFRVISYVERQVVLFDSIEDAALPAIREDADDSRLSDLMSQSKNGGHGEDISQKLEDFKVRIVLTAHPTQFYQPAVLDIMSELRGQIVQNDVNEIDLLLNQLGLTSLINTESPTPLEEAKNIIYFCKNVYYQAIGELYSRMKSKVTNLDNPEIVSLGFWPGGDRDGNPYVTSEITKEVANELRMTLMKCYYSDVKRLCSKITFKHVDEKIEALRDQLYLAMFNADYCLTYPSILNPLLEIKKIIQEKYNALYLNELQDTIDKVSIFKTHFASLDIRQDHSVHKQVITYILKEQGLINKTLEDLSTDQLLDILLNQEINLSDFQSYDPLVADTIANMIQLPSIQLSNGEQGCHRYIISNSEDIFSILFVFALFRWMTHDVRDINFDIIPLFETMKGMSEASQIMETIFNTEPYAEHLKRRNNKQTMMLGFSDGTKDGGYLKANWSIYKTKEALTALCETYQIKSIFFDGRGGPPARGGGKTHRFYASQGPKISNEEIQLTIQGQTITSTYGTKDQFQYSCEQLISAGLYNFTYHDEATISEASRRLLEDLSELSFKKYDALKHHEMFIPYLENVSPLKYYSKAKIGSRPVKRGQKKQLELTDLRAISFVGSWSLLKQNIPGYFGIGTALKGLKDQNRLEDLKTLYKEVPYFKALISNSMMSLSKCYFELTAYMEKNDAYSDFWRILFDEYQLSKKMILEITEYDELMADEPISKRSIENREAIVLPLLVIQQYALQKLAQDTASKVIFEKMVVRSVYGNINASRNSV
ncbi:phosphoenolpyruvate carboxylase [Ancylomarina euxinus]|uniref:Phosphoenolpyruvate carboxylase n=1 Tax=Ancylomarina euxinus TaxID=2283627 RepID=A0A425XXC6_9BACT|nr:phosphoenolpyruvate carboxylase [Ancylomarina euxinus]MCZ4696126.1 phosphoenolpyruvate carboxylase [Ancylomarina euxinus]MUP16535.1 phosphoenolpyruvate carboxylase [Ancylomarina euxinus]RRG19318.1 phosphoenolpyruvate carboxylase [Ancylomarina euxinus]